MTKFKSKKWMQIFFASFLLHVKASSTNLEWLQTELPSSRYLQKTLFWQFLELFQALSFDVDVVWPSELTWVRALVWGCRLPSLVPIETVSGEKQPNKTVSPYKPHRRMTRVQHRLWPSDWSRVASTEFLVIPSSIPENLVSIRGLERNLGLQLSTVLA